MHARPPSFRRRRWRNPAATIVPQPAPPPPIRRWGVWGTCRLPVARTNSARSTASRNARAALGEERLRVLPSTVEAATTRTKQVDCAMRSA
eukprot:10225082-Alexandrium_andersonii.AAC.1